MAVEEQSLYLDPQIRDWVLVPITIVMVLVGLLRHYVITLITGNPKKQPLAALREQRLLARSTLLRSSYPFIPPSSFLGRRSFLLDALSSGAYLKEPPQNEKDADGNVVEKPPTPANPLTDPTQMEGMMEGMKRQMVMMVPQTIIMGWINFFFSGFVLIKLPFPLTMRFKLMLQRGIETPDMDVTWVSSLSWYFLNLFGLNTIFRLILGEDNAADGTRDMAQMNMMTGAAAPGAPGQPQDFSKLHKAERDNLELVGLHLLEGRSGGRKTGATGKEERERAVERGERTWVGSGVEGRVLKMWKKERH